MSTPPLIVMASPPKMGSARAPAKTLRGAAAALVLLLALAPAALARDTRERVLLHVDADPVDYCLYDGRPYSEGARIDSPGGVLVCSYRERAAGSGQTYEPARGNRRLKWLPVEAPPAD